VGGVMLDSEIRAEKDISGMIETRKAVVCELVLHFGVNVKIGDESTVELIDFGELGLGGQGEDG